MIERGQTPHEEIWSYLQNKHQIKKCKRYQEFAKKSKSENSHSCDHWNMRKYSNKILSTGE